MNEQKNLFLAIAISIAIIVVFQFLLPAPITEPIQTKENEAEIVSKLEEIIMDSAKARAVYDASKSSMGMDVSAVDLLNIDMFATR